MTIVTKELLTALKTADSVCFHHGNENLSDGSEDKGCIRAIKRIPAKGNFKEAETEARFVVESYINHGYAYQISNTAHGKFNYAFAMWHHGVKYSPQVAAIVYSLKIGDQISLRWDADAHTNQYLRDAGIHGDVLSLRVIRKGAPELKFELDHSNCADNSARMVRPTSGLG